MIGTVRIGKRDVPLAVPAGLDLVAEGQRLARLRQRIEAAPTGVDRRRWEAKREKIVDAIIRRLLPRDALVDRFGDAKLSPGQRLAVVERAVTRRPGLGASRSEAGRGP